jgi:hypothetical protein
MPEHNRITFQGLWLWGIDLQRLRVRVRSWIRTTEIMTIYHKAISRFGPALQILKAAEEHAEYAAELAQYGIALLQDAKPKNAYQLAEERADCEIMEKQMDIILSNLNGAKNEWKRSKLDRLSKMITNKQSEVICDETIGGDGDA